jgi:ATP-dependent Clp protease ATP-binding subunit ClpA
MADPDNGNAYDEQELRRALFDDAAVTAVHNAEAEAKQRNQYGLDAQFLLLGLLHDRGGLVAQTVRRLGESPEQLELAVRMLVDNSSAIPAIPGRDEASASPTFWLTPEASQVFQIATDEAMRVSTNPRRLGPELLFLSN